MTVAMFKAMLLSLLNDRGALAMAFLLPLVFFGVLAEIFSSSSGSDMQLRVAFADEKQTELSGRLVNALTSSDAILVVGPVDESRERVESLVARGTADVGVIIAADSRELDDIDGFGPAPIVVVSDPIRAVAGPMLSGQIQQAYFAALPDVALGSVVQLIEDQFVMLDEEQQSDIAAGLAELGDAARTGNGGGWSFEAMIEQQRVAGKAEVTNHVAYYAGAIAFLFLLFASMQGAVSLTDERRSGILDRIMAGPGGMAVLVNGKFLFIFAQGFVQMTIIFVAAWLIYGVDLPGRLWSWVAITALACVAAAGTSLFVAAACRTSDQARNLWTVVVLISSVVGGSMVPRFFMPDWMRDVGWLTPNTWVLEAYSAIFWRNDALSSVLLPCALLALLGLAGFFGAQWIAVRRALN